MKKLLGLPLLILIVVTATSIENPQFLGADNIMNIIRWTGLYSIMAIGVAFAIITSGIDLSVGSLVGLVGSLLPFFLRELNIPLPVSLFLIIAIPLAIGLVHGLLITKLKLPPFVVTLCGLFVYRGIARTVTSDTPQGFGIGYANLRYLATGKPFSLPLPYINLGGVSYLGPIQIPMSFLIMVAVGVAAALFLNRTIWGRYLLALGRNEQAARFSGINTDRLVILAYILSSGLTGIAGMLFVMDLNSAQPSQHGNSFELYAIAGAVLGGCSLRGGEGSILGVILGIAFVMVLRNAINIIGIPTQLEFAMIGLVILAGVAIDEVLKRLSARRQQRARLESKAA
jgi:ribose transport system permease protein